MTIDIENLEVEINLDIVNGWGEVTYTKTELKQLCEAYAAKVLEDKEREIAELKTTVRSDNSKVIAALNANINDLREALEDIAKHTPENFWQNKAAEQALSKTPAQSLQSVINETIEKCAKSIDEMVVVYTKNSERYKVQGDDESVERSVNKGRAAMSCAEIIRALKQEVK